MTYPWNAGEVLAAADLNAEFASKLDLAGGKILQIVRATDSTNRTTTSATYVDVTGMSVTITPQKSDSAILVIAAFANLMDNSGTAGSGRIQITDSSNNALSGAEGGRFGLGIGGASTVALRTDVVLIGRSTPATTSATTYKLRFLSIAGATITIDNGSSSDGQMYAIEVSA